MSKQIKVVHLTSAHKDGDVRIFQKECVSLAKSGFEVYHLVPNSISREESGVKIISFQFPVTSRFRRMFFLVRAICRRAIELDADIYHLHDPELLRIARKLKSKGKIVIYDAHEDLPRDILSKKYIPAFLRKIISKMAEKFENRIAAQINGVVAATPFIRDRFLVVQKNTVDINNFPFLNEDAYLEYHQKTENAVCYTGTINSDRGIVELVDACEIANCNLLLAGEFRQAGLEHNLSQRPGWKRVENFGFLDRQGVLAVYDRAKIGLVTLHPLVNFMDALPVKMFEYMASGIPVIASDFPLWAAILKESDCGICVDPTDVSAISRAISDLLADPENAARLGRNGRRAVTEKFNWQAEQNKLIEFYKKLGNRDNL